MRQYSCEEAFQDTETKTKTKTKTKTEAESESELRPFLEDGAGAPLRAEICNSGENPTDI